MALITISSFTVQPTFTLPASVTSLVLRLWYNESFLDSDDQFVNWGTATTGFQKRVTCTISGGVITVPAFTLWSTVDAQVSFPQSINVASNFFRGNTNTGATIFNQNGTPPQWVIPSSFGSTMTYLEWQTYNSASVLVNPPSNYYTADEVNRLLANISPSGGTGFYFLSNYSTLAAAVSAIASNRATLLIDSVADVPDDLTIPENITLFFTNAGGIQPADTKTVTIDGPITAPPIKIFYNALAGEGTIYFGATYTGDQLQRDYWVEWWGAIADDVVDCTDSINAAFVALPNGCTMHFAAHSFYKHTGITIDRKFQVTVVGNEGQEGYADNGTMPILVYVGANGGTAVTLHNCYASTFRGFGVYGNNGADVTKGADIGILNTFDASGYPPISTHNHFIGLDINAINTRSGWVALDFSNPNQANNEQHVVENCLMVGGQQVVGSRTGIGLRLGHSQVKMVRVIRNTFIGTASSVDVLGNLRAQDNIHNSDICWNLIFPLETTWIEGDDVEQSVMYVNGGNVNGNVNFVSCRVGGFTNNGSSTSVPVVSLFNGSEVSFSNCFFLGPDGGGRVGPYFLYDSNHSTYVRFQDCRWFTASSAEIEPVEMAAGFNTANQTIVCKGRFEEKWGYNLFDDGSLQRMESVPGTLSPAVRRTLFMPGSGSSWQVSPGNFNLMGGDGDWAISGLYMPSGLQLSLVGDTGATTRWFTVVAVDAAGRRSLFWQTTAGNAVTTNTANATLSGSDYIHLTWWAQFPIPDHFEVWEVNSANSAEGRFVDNVTPSGTVFESYDVVANPTGSFVSFRPSRSEASFLNFRAQVLQPDVVVFAVDETTPDVAVGNCFRTANANPTTITNFLNGTNGQTIQVEVADANTTFANNGIIFNGTGAPLAGVEGVIYSFKQTNGSVWRRLL